MLNLNPFLTGYLLTLAFVLGAVLASFLACAASRRCRGESVFRGRSHCDGCAVTLAPWQLIPIVGYLLCKGKCPKCGCRIPLSCPVGELLLGLGFLGCLLKFDLTPAFALHILFLCILFYVSMTDLQVHIISDKALLLAIAARLAYFLLLEFSWRGLGRLVLNGLVFSVPILILVLILERILHREAMGGGDIKLLFVLGLYLELLSGPVMLLMACIIGIAAALWAQRRGGKGIPFGPCLSIAAVASLFWGQAIMQWYISIAF